MDNSNFDIDSLISYREIHLIANYIHSYVFHTDDLYSNEVELIACDLENYLPKEELKSECYMYVFEKYLPKLCEYVKNKKTYFDYKNEARHIYDKLFILGNRTRLYTIPSEDYLNYMLDNCRLSSYEIISFIDVSNVTVELTPKYLLVDNNVHLDLSEEMMKISLEFALRHINADLSKYKIAVELNNCPLANGMYASIKYN